MTRSEAIDLLQVLLLDERKVPGLKPSGLFNRSRRPATRRKTDLPEALPAPAAAPEEASNAPKGRILL